MNGVSNLCCTYLCILFMLCIYVVNVNNVECHRVEQEIMARIVTEMHNRQWYSSTVQSQLNPGRTSLHHVSDASSLVSDVETVDDPVIGL